MFTSSVRLGIAFLALLVVGGCSTAPADGPGGRASVTERNAISDSALDRRLATHRALEGFTVSDRATARTVIDAVRVAARGTKHGYARAQYGPAWTDAVDTTWGHNGCRTREDVLRRDLTAIEYRPGTQGRDGRDCVVLTGYLRDPYTGTLIDFSKSRPTEVQIDHVIPLFYAWQLGASRWPAVKRRAFANDPLNLVAASGPANEQKNASGPASWLPPNRVIRCGYGLRFARVALKYHLAVTPSDREQMLRDCR